MRSTKREVPGLMEFMLACSPRFKRPYHLERLTELLDASLETPLRLVLSMPPQHGKSSTINHHLVRCLVLRPDLYNAYVSYGGGIVKTQANRAKRIAERSPWPLDLSHQTIGEWTAAEGGGLIWTSIEGSLTGFEVTGALVIDDPYRNREQAESLSYQTFVDDWFDDVVQSRTHPSTSIIVIQTRWNDNDLAGQKAREEGWLELNLPALREDGTALWEERHPLWFLERKRDSMDTFNWSSIYMGRPVPRGQRLFSDEVANLYDIEDLPTSGYREITGCDFAYTDGAGDWTVFIEGRAKDGVLWLTNLWRGRVRLEDWAPILKEFPSPWLEPGGQEKVIVDLLRKEPYGVKVRVLKSSRGSPITFAVPSAAAWNRSEIMVPRHASWRPDLEDELHKFTGYDANATDDQVKALSVLYNKLLGKSNIDDSLPDDWGRYRPKIGTAW